jgi:hypothetical protein
MDSKYSDFHSITRELILILLTFITLFLASFISLVKYYKKYAISNDFQEIKDIQAGRSPILFLCSLCLSLAIANFLLVPFTLIANKILYLFPNSIYLIWLDRNLITGYWNWLFIGNELFLFIILPFTHFFIESQDDNSVFDKTRETITQLGFIYGLVYIMAFCLGMLFDYKGGGGNVLIIINIMICVISAFITLRAIPTGFNIIFSWIKGIAVSPSHRSQLKDLDEEIEMENQFLREKMQKLQYSESPSSSRVSWRKNIISSNYGRGEEISPTVREKLNNAMQQVVLKERDSINRNIVANEMRRKLISKEMRRSVFGRNVIFVILSACKFYLFYLVCLYVWVAMILYLIVNIVRYIPLFGKHISDLLDKPITILEWNESVITFFFSLSTFIGLLFRKTNKYDSSRKEENTSMRLKIRNMMESSILATNETETSVSQRLVYTTSITLLVSSSIPMIVRVLGLSSFELVR